MSPCAARRASRRCSSQKALVPQTRCIPANEPGLVWRLQMSFSSAAGGVADAAAAGVPNRAADANSAIETSMGFPSSAVEVEAEPIVSDLQGVTASFACGRLEKGTG